MLRFYFPVLLILALRVGYAQQLRVNDRLPALDLTGTLKWSSDTLRLYSLKNKLIILDFWTFSCTTCLDGFFKIDSLQKEFKDEVQFIAVNAESPELTRKFIKNHPHLKFPDIPFVSGDTILASFFPRAYSPWHVWVDSAHTVRYITDAHNATRKHLRSFLQGEPLAINQLNFDPSYLQKETLLGDTGLIKKIRSYYFLSACIPEFDIGNFIGDTGKGTFMLSQNSTSVFELLKIAFGEKKLDFSFPSTIEFPAGMDSIYSFETDPDKIDAWTTKHCYNYQRVVPLEQSAQIFKMMRQDLVAYFNLSARIEQKQVKSLALERILPSKPIGTVNIQDREKNFGEQVSSTNGVEGFVRALNYVFAQNSFETFVVDDTNFDGITSLAIDFSLIRQRKSINDINEQLKKSNLRLVPKLTTADVLVISK